MTVIASGVCVGSKIGTGWGYFRSGSEFWVFKNGIIAKKIHLLILWYLH